MARYKHFYVLLVLIMLALCMNIFPDAPGDQYARKYLEITNVIKDHYIVEKKDDELFESAMTGMVSSLDRHCQFMKTDDIDDLNTDISGELEGGIGIEYDIPDNKHKVITVITPVIGTPAHKAGIFAGDQIIAVDDVNIEGLTLDDIRKKIRGKVGTSVILTVRRADDPEQKKFKLNRENIKIFSVRSQGIIDPKWGIGYLHIRSFQRSTPDEVRAAVDTLVKQGMQALILDLRDNPGGTLDAGEETANIFIKDGIIVSVKGRDPEENEVFKATGENTYTKEMLPMVVLADDGSASASEIVAGALQDHKRAILIGTQTYGKGSVQKIFYLDKHKKYALRLTVAKYFTPSGRCIHREVEGGEGGLTPDIVVDEKTIKAHADDISKWRQLRWIESNRTQESKEWHDNQLKKVKKEDQKKPPVDPFVEEGVNTLKGILIMSPEKK